MFFPLHRYVDLYSFKPWTITGTCTYFIYHLNDISFTYLVSPQVPFSDIACITFHSETQVNGIVNNICKRTSQRGSFINSSKHFKPGNDVTTHNPSRSQINMGMLSKWNAWLLLFLHLICLITACRSHDRSDKIQNQPLTTINMVSTNFNLVQIKPTNCYLEDFFSEHSKGQLGLGWRL